MNENVKCKMQNAKLRNFRTYNLELRTWNLELIIYSLLFTVYCLLGVTACVHTPPVLSDAHLKAIEFNQKAESAFKKSDYRKALNLYNEALKINSSIENFDGIAKNLINLSIIYRKLGDKDNAHKCVDEVVQSLELGVQSELVSEASFVKARFYTDDGYYNQALEWAEKALSFCKDTKCRIEGKIYNLKSRIAFLSGDFSIAETFAIRGLELNEKTKDIGEIANSLRIRAEIKLKKEEYDEAKKLFEDALIIDKSLGLSKKIAMDLMGIGNAFFNQDKPWEALKYFKRALSISETGDDKQGVEEATNVIMKFH